MPHPAVIPLLLIPHVALPAGLVYVLYLDHQETISRVRHAQVNESSLVPLPPVPPVLPNPIIQPVQVRLSGPRVKVPLNLNSKIRKLISLDSTKSYNCHSPMRKFAQENVKNFKKSRFNYLYRKYDTRILKTPMRDLAKRRKFRKELTNFRNEIFRKEIWRGFFHAQIVPKIARQRGIIMSKLASFVRRHIWYADIVHQIRCYNDTLMRSSPMFKLAQTEAFREHIVDQLFFRQFDYHTMETDPIRRLTCIEKDNIINAARRMKFSRTVRMSKMHQFVSKFNNRTAIIYHAACNLMNIAEMTSSPLRKWTLANCDIIKFNVQRMNDIRQARYDTLKKIDDLLAKNYGTLYRSHSLRAFRCRNNIPEVKFQDGCTSYADIIFPENVQVVDRFLADSNLDGFSNCTIYTGKNHFQSHAVSLLATEQGMPTINDLTDAAQTFVNISHVSHSDTQVKILSDSNKLNIDAVNATVVRRSIDLYFIRRDRADFKIGDFRNCRTKINDFMKRYPDLQYTIGYLDRWLSGTMIINITGPLSLSGNVKYTNLTTDVIQVVNLIKGFIFKKVMDRTCWLHLPPFEPEKN